MTGIDTNILVRYLTQDGPEAPAVSLHLEAACTRDNPGFICLIVLCELIWVLRHAYKYPRKDIADILEGILTATEFEVESSLLAWRALQEYREGNADFSDYLIGQVCRQNESTPVMTLDQKAAKGQNFTLLET